ESRNANMGADSLVKTPDIRHGNQPLLYERYAGLDYTPLNVDLGSAAISFVQNQEGEAANWQANEMATVGTGFLVLGGKILVSLMEWAFSLDLVTAAGSPLTAVVNALHHQFYDQFIGVAIIGLGIFLLYVIVAGRVLRAVVAIVWAALALTLAAILMEDPLGYASAGNDFTNQASQMALGAISSVDANGINRDATTAAGPGQDAQVRIFADRVWRLWVYQPWTILEFGELDPTVPGSQNKLAAELLDKKSGRSSSFDADFQRMPQEVKDWYNGDRGGDRLVAAAIALLGLLGAFVFMLALCLSIFAFALGAEALWMLLPGIALVWPIPGFGRNLAIRWFQLLIGCYVGRILLSVYLGIVMILDGVLSGFATSAGWLIAVILQLALLWLAFQHRHTFLHLGRKVIQPGAPASEPAAKPAQTRPVHRTLHHADRRLAAPLRAQRLGAGTSRLGVGAQRALPTSQQVVSGKAAAVASRGAAAGAGGTAATAAGSVASGGALLVGLGLVRGARVAARGYDSLRRGVQAQGAHLHGGSPSGGTGAQGPSTPPGYGFFSIAAGHIDHRRREPLRQAEAVGLAEQRRQARPPKRTKALSKAKVRLPKGAALHEGPQESTSRVIKPELEADRS
nr:hypothetical protein [Candidatus Dormibacteraeota bacterium]